MNCQIWKAAIPKCQEDPCDTQYEHTWAACSVYYNINSQVRCALHSCALMWQQFSGCSWQSVWCCIPTAPSKYIPWFSCLNRPAPCLFLLLLPASFFFFCGVPPLFTQLFEGTVWIFRVPLHFGNSTGSFEFVPQWKELEASARILQKNSKRLSRVYARQVHRDKKSQKYFSLYSPYLCKPSNLYCACAKG